MSARKKPPKKTSSGRKKPVTKAPAKKKPLAKTKEKPKKKAVQKKAASPRTSSGPKAPKLPKVNPEFDSYVRRLAKCGSVEDLRKCSERPRRGDPVAWEKTFDVVLFGLSYKDEAGARVREAIKSWAEGLMLSEILTPEQYAQILGRVGLAPPTLPTG